MKKFMFCGGIEDTFISDPHPDTGKTLDEYELTGHYDNFINDFVLVSQLGIKGLRWGVPWYRVEPEKGIFDFSFTDMALEKLDKLGIEVILDLMHYGTPSWLAKSFLEPSYVESVCNYTRRVLERYGGIVHFVTPFNEPHTAAEFCGKLGQWPPYMTDDKSYFEIMRQIVLGAQEQSRIARSMGMETVQVECSGGSFTEDSRLSQLAYVDTVKQSCFFDFLTGRTDGIEPFVEYGFSTGGISEKDIAAFGDGKTDIGIMGINFYPQFSFKDICMKDGAVVYSNHPMWVDDLDDVLRRRYERYGCRMMITETSIRDDEELKARWIKDSAAYCIDSKYDLLGYTYFPLIDMIDWEYRISLIPDKESFTAKFGLFDGNRSKRPAADVYRDIVLGGENGRI